MNVFLLALLHPCNYWNGAVIINQDDTPSVHEGLHTCTNYSGAPLTRHGFERTKHHCRVIFCDAAARTGINRIDFQVKSLIFPQEFLSTSPHSQIFRGIDVVNTDRRKNF